jgi:KDO2-lipid IV(A) lauroyltransferase
MSRSPGDLLMRAGLELVDVLFRSLPERVAYGVADLLGEAWYRLAPGRRRLVGAQLARVAEASGRPLAPAGLRRLVRAAFVAHARYYLEVVRVPHYDPARIDEIISWSDPNLEGLAQAGGVIVVCAHYGNFEPAALWLEKHGLRWMAPMERIRPRALFEYLRSRRGAGSAGGELVVPPGVARQMLRAVRDGAVVAIATDRDLGTPSVRVTMFDHPAQVPSGPASMAILTGAPVVALTVRRIAPGRFHAQAEPVPWAASGDREADVAELMQRITDILARRIAENPEQWWGSFQPVWADLAGAARA